VEIFSFYLMLVVRGGGARAGRLVSSSENALDSVGCFGVLTEYISISSVTAAYGFALTASPFGKRRSAGPAQRNQRSRPLRTAPRLGSGFLRCGIHPGASPSGWLRWHLHAMCSTASNGAARPSPDEHLHSACRGGGWIKIKSCRRANARPDEW